MIKIYVGKSASGKDYFLNKDVKSGKFERVVSYTTRPKRPKEVNGRDYYFVSKELFLDMQKTGRLLESRSYNTLVDGKEDIWYYGSPFLTDYKDKDYVVVVDVQGAIDYIKRYGSAYVVINFVEVSDEIRKNRAIRRGGFNETEWNRRVDDDSIKFSELAKYYLAYLDAGIKVINNEFELNNGETSEYTLECEQKELATMIRANFSAAFNIVQNGAELSYILDYGFSNADILQLMSLYRIDTANKYRTKILDLLSDCNFHTECNYLLDEDCDAICIMYQGS